jgi:hypothetical protein
LQSLNQLPNAEAGFLLFCWATKYIHTASFHKSIGGTKTVESNVLTSQRAAMFETIQQTLGSSWFDYKPWDDGRPGLRVTRSASHRDGAETTIHELYQFCTGRLSLRLRVTRSKRLQEGFEPLLRLGPVATVFAKLLAELPLAPQPTEVMQSLTEWFSRLLQGEPSTIVAGMCPDYQVVDGVYTFDELGSGIGLVAAKVLGAIQQLGPFVQKRKLPLRVVVAMADHEADNEANCQRVGLTRAEFYGRLAQSQQAFAAECNGLPVITTSITKVGDWAGALAEAERRIASGYYAGPFAVTEENLLQAARARAPFYARWYGRGLTDAEALACLRNQIAEYHALPGLLCRSYPNPCVLDGGAPGMRIFMHGLSDRVLPMIGVDVGKY